MRRRFARGIAANLYGQAVTVAIQLLTVPGFLHAWGTMRFGHWLILSAWASVLSLADCGLMVASGNAATMAVARGDRAGAGRVFAQTFAFVLSIALVLGGIVLLTLALLPNSVFGDALLARDLRFAAMTLSGAALAGLPLGMLELGFRADGAYATGFSLSSSIRLLETAAGLAIALGGEGLAAAAAGVFTVRVAGTVGMLILLRRAAPWVRFRPDGWRAPELRRLARPALAALAVPAGLALSLQATTLIAGAVLSSGAVALFVTTRTLTRTIVQGLGLINHALMPEMSIAAGQGDNERSSALLRVNFAASLLVLVPGWALLFAFGPAVMLRWTGLLRPSPLFFGLMATTALLHGCWLSATNLLLAANRQAEYAYRFVIVAAGSCALAAVLGRTSGLDGIAAAGLLAECGMVALVLPGQIQAAFRSNPTLQSADGRP